MAAELDRDIAAVRRFNRFYTRELGVLRRTFLDTAWTLGEMRVLFEIARGAQSAAEIARSLDLDAAYLSRLLGRLEKQKLIARKAAPDDARQYRLTLSPAGAGALAEADKRQIAQTEGMLRRLNNSERKDLTAAMATIESLLTRKLKP